MDPGERFVFHIEAFPQGTHFDKILIFRIPIPPKPGTAKSFLVIWSFKAIGNLQPWTIGEAGPFLGLILLAAIIHKKIRRK